MTGAELERKAVFFLCVPCIVRVSERVICVTGLSLIRRPSSALTDTGMAKISTRIPRDFTRVDEIKLPADPESES